MRIVIIGGLPCSGKSKLAERLQQCWRQPLLSKDQFKESIFDMLGAADRAWSRRVSLAAYDLLFRQAAELARSGVECILEGNFRSGEHERRFDELRDLGATFLQVHCRADAEVLVRRFRHRANTESRHKGHADKESLEELTHEIRNATQQPLAIEGGLIECDTTEDWSAAIDAAVTRVLDALAVEQETGDEATTGT